MRLGRPLTLFSLATLALAASCKVPDDLEQKPPLGVIRGAVLYTGPLPCTQAGHVMGGAAVLVFNQNLLPPPEGLGTNARSLAAVPGDELFAAVTSSLTFREDGAIWCPAADAPHVSVSAQYLVGPLEAGRFQLRGFYDRDGDFSPILKIHNLPTAGDIGGGALANPTDAALGAKPIYQQIEIGDRDANGKLVLPADGAAVDGVAVNLGLELTTPRPIAHVLEVRDTRPNVPESDRATSLDTLRMPIDQLLAKSPVAIANAAEADNYFIRLVFRAGVPSDEQATAFASPLSLQAGPPYDFFRIYSTKNADGSPAVVPEKTPPGIAIRDLFPQTILARLDWGDGTNQTPQAAPAVILQALVSKDGLLSAISDQDAKSPTVQAALRPSVICTQPEIPGSRIYLVTPSFKAENGEVVIDDPVELAGKVAARFGRSPADVSVIEGCLPPGRYSANLVYDTSQAWTLPNEAGVCSGLEKPGGTGCVQDGIAGSRPLVASQAAYVRIGGYQKPGSCNATAEGVSYVRGIPAVCLTQLEIDKPDLLDQRIANPDMVKP